MGWAYINLKATTKPCHFKLANQVQYVCPRKIIYFAKITTCLDIACETMLSFSIESSSSNIVLWSVSRSGVSSVTNNN